VNTPPDPTRIFNLADDAPTRRWSRSEFPHPLVTVDYDATGEPYRVVAVAPHLTEIIQQCVTRATDPRHAVTLIRASV
jgi:hypothetical protein